MNMPELIVDLTQDLFTSLGKNNGYNFPTALADVIGGLLFEIDAYFYEVDMHKDITHHPDFEKRLRQQVEDFFQQVKKTDK